MLATGYNDLYQHHEKLKDRYDKLQKSNNTLVENHKALSEKFQEEKNRKLTWKERLLGKKVG